MMTLCMCVCVYVCLLALFCEINMLGCNLENCRDLGYVYMMTV